MQAYLSGEFPEATSCSYNRARVTVYRCCCRTPVLPGCCPALIAACMGTNGATREPQTSSPLPLQVACSRDILRHTAGHLMRVHFRRSCYLCPQLRLSRCQFHLRRVRPVLARARARRTRACTHTHTHTDAHPDTCHTVCSGGDDSGCSSNGLSFDITVPFTAGKWYWFAVGPYGSGSPAYRLSITLPSISMVSSQAYCRRAVDITQARWVYVDNREALPMLLPYFWLLLKLDVKTGKLS